MDSSEDKGREALIHLRVPAELKARWVRESRAAGMRLTDWIITTMNRSITQDRTLIPLGLSDSQHWARFFWWDGTQERLRAGLRAICDDMDGVRAPWESLVWVVLTPDGCLSATNRLPAPRVDSVDIDDESRVTDFWRQVCAAHRHDKSIRDAVTKAVESSLGSSDDPVGEVIGRLSRARWATSKTDVAILRVAS